MRMLNVNFGKVFRYIAKLSNGEYVVWRVLAESRTEADAKVKNYLLECHDNGFFNIPVEVEFASKEDNLVLF